MKDKYFMVRVPNYAGTPSDLEAELRWHFQRSVSVVEIHESQPDYVRKVRDLYAADDYDTGDEIRTGVEEDLFQNFSELV